MASDTVPPRASVVPLLTVTLLALGKPTSVTVEPLSIANEVTYAVPEARQPRRRRTLPADRPSRGPARWPWRKRRSRRLKEQPRRSERATPGDRCGEVARDGLGIAVVNVGQIDHPAAGQVGKRQGICGDGQGRRNEHVLRQTCALAEIRLADFIEVHCDRSLARLREAIFSINDEKASSLDNRTGRDWA